MPNKKQLTYLCAATMALWLGGTVPATRAVPAAASHVDPWSVPVAQLRRWRGDFGGIRIPAIAPMCPEDPVTHIRCAAGGRVAKGLAAGVLFTNEYGVYTPAQRAAIRAAYRAHGYRQFPISLDHERRDYRDMFPGYPRSRNPELLQELWDAGLYPVCFAMADQDTVATSTPEERRLCRIVVPKWEIDEPDGGDTARIDADIRSTRAAFPDALLYVHFSPRTVSGGTPASRWWRWAHDRLHVAGLLYQDNRWNDPEAVIQALAPLQLRFGAGEQGWPTGIDLVLFETDIYPKFWDHRTERESVAYNDRILRAPVPVRNGARGEPLAGFCSGGRSR